MVHFTCKNVKILRICVLMLLKGGNHRYKGIHIYFFAQNSDQLVFMHHELQKLHEKDFLLRDSSSVMM